MTSRGASLGLSRSHLLIRGRGEKRIGGNTERERERHQHISTRGCVGALPLGDSGPADPHHASELVLRQPSGAAKVGKAPGSSSLLWGRFVHAQRLAFLTAHVNTIVRHPIHRPGEHC